MHSPASDLGYLLHKHPDKFQSIDLSVGQAHVFYPEMTESKASVCLMLDIDPVEMVRGGKHNRKDGFALGQYVNDRPYVASSFMSVAIAKAFTSALNGKCNNRPELVDLVFDFEVEIDVIPAPSEEGGESLIRSFFEPLGYEIELEQLVLDPKFKDWGMSKYFSLKLQNKLTLKELLNHLYVLIPALDNAKHYFVSEAEIEKLLAHGKGWLENHPANAEIAKRYLINLKSLGKLAMAHMNDPDMSETEDQQSSEDQVKRISLHDKRLLAVAEKLKLSGATSVLDLGCGEGKLIRLLLKEQQFKKIAGMDVSYSELLRAKERLHFEEMAPRQKERIELFQGSLIYRDKRFEGYDAAAVVEVIEHMELNRLPAFEQVLFGAAKPKTIVLTTPNKEFNAHFEGMKQDAMRHDDHRFEWSREEFAEWSNRVAQTHGYSVEIFPLGDKIEGLGAPSQMAVFEHGN